MLWELAPLRYAPRCALLPLVVGTDNKGYTVQPSARASPKFFFRYAPEKLRISLTLYAIAHLLSEFPAGLHAVASLNGIKRNFPLFLE